jgi:uncharacterized membrane protein YgdD (TMEM256/DUF423 family)
MNRSAQRWIGIAALLIALATIIGAFGAHALKDTLSAERYQVLQTAVHYQFFHALGLLGLGVLLLQPGAPSGLSRAGALISAGILIFCGSLYALVSGAPSLVGAITPIGGLCLIAGWLMVAVQLLRPDAIRH